MEGLKPGRIVYYHDGLDDIPSMVTHVYEDGSSIDCTSFGRTGITYHNRVPFSDVIVKYVWHWMFEGQQTRYQPDRVEKESAT